MREFLAKSLNSKQGEDNPKPLPTRQDTFNYKGASLFSTYNTLWRQANDYDIGAAPNTLAVENTFSQLATFPFADVVAIMSDHVRHLVRKQCRLTFIPYTKKHLDALTRLMTIFPEEELVRLAIQTVLGKIHRIKFELTERPARYSYNNHGQVNQQHLRQHCHKAIEVVYTIPSQYLWIVYTPLLSILRQIASKVDKETELEVSTCIKYLEDHYSIVKPNLNIEFENQFAEDITTLLVYSHPHPEVLIALTRVERILKRFYTPAKIQQTFSEDIVYNINRYIGNANHKLDAKVIDWFKQRNNPADVIDEKILDESRVECVYNEFIRSLAIYQSNGEGKQRVLELAEWLRRQPYDEVDRLPNFDDKIHLAKLISKGIPTQ